MDIAAWIARNYIELAGALGAAAAAYVAKSKGYLTIGRPKERRHCPDIVKGLCGDHKSVIASIREHEQGSARREQKIDTLTEKVNEINDSLSKIEGFLQGRNGYHN
jgi:hypothetical protein